MICTNKARLCKKARPLYKCKRCNMLSTTLSRVLGKSPELKVKFHSLTPEERKAWLASHRNSAAAINHDGVRAKLKEYFEQESVQKSEIKGEQSFNADFDWMDETDVRDHFKKKPQVADDTINNAPQIKCEHTKRVLYGVPKYSSATREKVDNAITTQTKFKSSGEMKEASKQKKPRPSMTPKV